MLNNIVATQKNNVAIFKSRSKATSRAAQGLDITKGDNMHNREPIIGRMQDKDDSPEHAVAILSPIKGKGS